jgi:uncharacterized protein YicC (UPF0701 family)
MSELYSMTGFAQTGTARATYTLKSYNHKFLDLNLALPPVLAPLDRELRGILGGKIQRGKVLFVVGLSAEDPALFPRLNRAYLQHLRAEWKAVFPDDPDLPRGLLESERLFLSAEALPPDLEQEVRDGTSVCLDRFLLSRWEEGEKLLPSLLAAVREIRDLVAGFEPKLAQARQDLLAKLKNQLYGLLSESPADPGRIEQEAALLCSRMDPEEETVRAAQFAQRLEETLLKPPRPAGKLLDFLVQELAREFQTLSQKVRDLAIREDVVRLKMLAERVREQIQNIE